MTINQQFSEYVTSGAFNMSLSRNQIANLSVMSGDGAFYVDRAEALERRGLIERVATYDKLIGGDHERQKWRLTEAGVCVLELLAMSGLTNGEIDAKSIEINQLKAELKQASADAAEAIKKARSIYAKYDKLNLDIQEYMAIQEKDKLPIRIFAKDPLPHVCAKCLVEPVAEEENPC